MIRIYSTLWRDDGAAATEALSSGQRHAFHQNGRRIDATAKCKSSAGVICKNISFKLPAMVISLTGKAISPFSIKPDAARIIAGHAINAHTDKLVT